MNTQENEMSLIRKVIKGDTDLFGELVATHQKRIFRMISCFTEDREEAADLTQETFLQAFRGLSTFRGESTFFTWLYRIGFNVAVRAALKKRRLCTSVPLDSEASEAAMVEQTEAASASPLQFLEEKELLQAIERALESMPEQLRSVLFLRLIEDLSYTAIAEAEAIPVNTVRSRLWRARAQLAIRLAEPGERHDLPGAP
ncbi:sigma-70 family RNA polymerase sigma factor [Massilia sp. R2A-15]|uniref:RNA polymerase sigma factor n=1 Tax=Massilia sp. R2A-15 TaxID=3064278 RepID=UPI002735441C|nr:sigma-70 family RNA polymerase sigma factor [Massilia sp. R2A-15]WLI88229.1 sigma-70 family RNA polymerase sigma factor [Massilia sp. R2A-15]